MVSISGRTMELIKWSKEASNACKLHIISSCRETPPIIRQWHQSCLFEILTDAKLTRCRVEHESELVFVRRLGQKWVISTWNSTRCHRVRQHEEQQHTMTTNNVITLPPIALITLEAGTALSCDQFFLSSTTNSTTDVIITVENQKIKQDNSKLIDLYHTISNNSHWEKIPYISGNIKHVFDYLITNATTCESTHAIGDRYWTLGGLIAFAGLALILIALQIHLKRRVAKKQAATVIAMPRIQDLTTTATV